MTSDRKIKANRANAGMSTRSENPSRPCPLGKKCVSPRFEPLPSRLTQALCEEVQALARQIAGEHASTHIQILAYQVAQAQVDLRRIRYARHQFLAEALADRYGYEARALTRLKVKVMKQFLTPKLAYVPLPGFIVKFLTSAQEGPAKFATMLSKETKQLLAFDRYETRALSRRKFAIRALDEARGQA